MSGLGMVWARQQRVGRAGAKALLLLLAEISNEQGETYQNQGHLADILEVSRKSVNENLAYLEERGFVLVSGRIDPVTKRRMSSRIEVLIGDIEALPSPRQTHVTSSYTDPPTHVTIPAETTPDPCNAALQLVNNKQLLKQEALKPNAGASAQTELFNPPPREPKDVVQMQAAAIAKDAYDGTKGAYAYVSTLTMVKWAIKAGYDPNEIQQSIRKLWHSGKPLTKSLLGQVLEGIVKPGQGPSRAQQRMDDSKAQIARFAEREAAAQKEIRS